MNKSLKVITITLAILIVIAIILANIIKTNKKAEEQNNTIKSGMVATENEIEQARSENLANKTEASRIKSYIGNFFTTIESKDYQKAYNMLFDSFKNNYFQTESKFEEYMKSKYPKNVVLNYTNLDREGTYYIATLEVIDGLSSANKISQRIVVEETGLNEFKISFQVQ